jgi:hypothetical protein
MKFLSSIVAVLTAFLTPMAGLLIMMVSFLVLDTIAGIYVAQKIEGWAGFKSHKLFNLVVKSFFYLSTIIMAFIADRFLIEGSLFGIQLFLAKSIAVVWCYVELKSIDEKSQKLGNKSFWSVISEFLAKLKDVKKDLNELSDKDNQENK